MTKLHAVIEGCLNENAIRLTNFMKLLKDVVISDDGMKQIFQNIQLLNFEASSNAVKQSKDGVNIFRAANKPSFQNFK